MIRFAQYVTRQELEENVTSDCHLQSLAVDAAVFLYDGSLEKFQKAKPEIWDMMEYHSQNNHAPFTAEQRSAMMDMIMEACGLCKQIETMAAAERMSTVHPGSPLMN